MRGDLLEILAREKLGLPREWTVYRWQVVKRHGETIGTDLEGALQTGYLKWGKQGKVALYLSDEEAATLALAWEQRTGYCQRCMGRGETVASCGISGTTYRECSVCVGSGKSAAHPEAFTPWKPEPPLFEKPEKKAKKKKRTGEETPTKRAHRELREYLGIAA